MLALQVVDSALEQIEHRRKRLPERAALAEVTSRRAAHDALQAAQREAQRVAEATISASEQEAAVLTAKRTRLEAQLKTVIAPRQAEALMHEIEMVTAKRSELDDAELAALDDAAAAETELETLRVLGEQLNAEMAAATASLAAANGALDVEAEGQRRLREQRRAVLSDDDYATYERRRAQFAGVAIAALEGSRCTGCHLELSRAEADALRKLPADEVGECPECGRLLVR